MGIYDAMMLCRADVQTYCFGLAASMGAFLLGAGAKGKRHSMPNSRIMIHQPLGGASGQAVDIEIQAKEIMYHKVRRCCSFIPLLLWHRCGLDICWARAWVLSLLSFHACNRLVQSGGADGSNLVPALCPGMQCARSFGLG
jgi:hypothetical protein